MKRFEKMVNERESLNISINHSIIDVWRGSEYSSDIVISKVDMT